MTKVLNDRALALYKYLLERQRATLPMIMRELDEIYHRSEETSTMRNSTITATHSMPSYL